jgi:hypothetical protein
VLPRLARKPPAVCPGCALAAQPESASHAQAAQARRTQIGQAFSVTVPANGSIDVPLRMPQAGRASVMLMTHAGITATLIDPSGATVQSSPAFGESARDGQRGFPVMAPAVGTWQLRLTSAHTESVPAAGLVYLAGAPLHLDLRVLAPGAQQRLTVQATLKDGAAAMRGGRISASMFVLDGDSEQLHSIELLDDGTHGDGAADDGVFGAYVARPGSGMFAIMATAQLNGIERSTSAVFTPETAFDGPGDGGDPTPPNSHRVFVPVVIR